MKESCRWALAVLVLMLSTSLLACTSTPTSSPVVTPPTASQSSPPPETSIPPTETETVTPTTPPTQQTTTPPEPTTTTPTQTTTPPNQTVILAEFWETFRCHFGFMPALWDYENAREAGGAFNRPFFELFQWGVIEKTPGNFDFSETDMTVKDSQAFGLHILANIQPFASWDQQQGYNDPNHKGKPYDMEAYANFLTVLVERYDGDSIDDMPGLTVPIKHWELMNEPEFQTDPIYFQGTPADYVDTLKITYQTVKQADPEAYIVQGGMAGMMTESAAWWQGVFDAGGGDYLDIMNMHSIGHGEHLNIPAFKQFLEEYGLSGATVAIANR